jgi:hypothetical protein
LLELILIRQLDLDRLPDEHPLEFSQKLDLVKALVIGREPKPKADLLCAIGKLNSVRNRLAHTLMSSTEVEKAVKSIIDSYHSKANSKLDRNETLPVQLKSCISKLCKFLNRVIFHFYNLEQQKVDLLGEQMK